MTYIGQKPANKPVNQTDIEDDAISLAKLAGGTDGNIISYDASGNPVAIATGNDGQVLTSTGAGSPPAFEALPASGVSLSGSTNNTVVTVTGANAIQGEANLTYDGSTLTVKPGSNVHQLKLEQNNATDYWSLHADSSGGPLSFNRYTGGAETERMNISSTGELAVTSSDSASGTQTLKVATTGNANPAYANLVFKSGGNTSGAWIKGVQASGGNDGRLEFHTNNSGTVGEAMRVMFNGTVLINTTSTLGNTQGVLHVKGKANNNIARFGAGTNGEGVIFVNPSNTQVGYIAINSSSTTYSTSSDYRLKENAVAISDGITRLKTLKPYRFNFIADNDADGNPTETVDGFFAHEVTAVPEAISGDKDAMHPEVLYTDKDELPEGKNIGDVKEATKIKPQAIDQSKLVPLLTSALQEAITKIETLETRVKTLEDA